MLEELKIFRVKRRSDRKNDTNGSFMYRVRAHTRATLFVVSVTCAFVMHLPVLVLGYASYVVGIESIYSSERSLPVLDWNESAFIFFFCV